MEEQEMKTRYMIAIVKEACDELSDAELETLNLVAQLDQYPHGRLFDYKKVQGLFTENGGLKMHDETKAALAVVVNDRLLSD